ncbi:OTU ovarian tumor-like cysteine protease [Phytophthora cinnamomi]|uniref:OTU ovarian tumor-like cysteine protease n=1 Tax=Phytophthora cinnamomi TaxID=4785 RepID=UPI00355A5D36|nr:OTU ovarian tumor-like cysteine protease [Phytophthora cinnamomi]
MSLAWLRSHARNRDRGNSRSRSNSQRLAAQRAHRQFAGAEAYAPRVTYDNSFVVDSSVTSRDANWLTDEQYKRQYLRLGWEVAPIRKDGNCLFRALSDQLYGHERRHLELRRRLVDFIDLERAFFEPFVAGEGVVEYCERLREAGAWGGHPELVAASRLLGVNIIVHTGPVKRLRIDTDKYALTKEGKGKTINLLLKHDHYSSLRKREKPLEQQHGCSDMCLCRRVVTPSRASLDSRASLGARPSDLSLSFVDVGRRSSLGARPVDITLGPDKRPRSLKGAYGRKPVPDASNSAERSSGRKKHQRAPLKVKARAPEKPKAPAPAPPAQAAPAKPRTPAPAAPSRPNAPAPAPPAKPKTAAPAPPSKPKSPAPAPPSKPKSPAPAPPAKSRPTAPAPTPTPSPPVKKVQAPAPVVQTVKPKAASPRTKPRAQIPTPPETPKSPGVVLFQPESLKPVVKPKAPLVVLFEPEKTPVSKPTSSPVSKKATVNTATPAKPTSATVLDVEVEEPEAVSVKPRNAGVHLPRRAVFNGGRRRRSSAAALALMQEVSASLNAPEPVVVAPPAPAPVPSPPAPPATRSVAIKKSSKKVFHQGRPVSAAC